MVRGGVRIQPAVALHCPCSAQLRQAVAYVCHCNRRGRLGWWWWLWQFVMVSFLGRDGPTGIIIDVLNGALQPRVIPQPLRGRFWRWARFRWILGAARRIYFFVCSRLGGFPFSGVISVNGFGIFVFFPCIQPRQSLRWGGAVPVEVVVLAAAGRSVLLARGRNWRRRRRFEWRAGKRHWRWEGRNSFVRCRGPFLPGPAATVVLAPCWCRTGSFPRGDPHSSDPKRRWMPTAGLSWSFDPGDFLPRG